MAGRARADWGQHKKGSATNEIDFIVDNIDFIYG